MMMCHVFDLCCPAYLCRHELGWGDDFSLSGFGSLGQGAKSCAGVYGAVSLCGTEVSPCRLDLDGDPLDHWADVTLTPWPQCHGTGFVAGNRDHETDVGRPVVVSDPSS